MEGEQKIQQGKLSCLIASYDYQEDNTDLEMILEEDHEDTSSSSFDGSDLSSSSSSSDFLDDDTSSSTSSQSDGALFDLSELMSHLPIKRGLSKFYKGKSQSFTSLARVTSLEDLAKKVGDGGYGKRFKACKSYGGELNLNISKHKSSTIKSPKSTISKKSYSSSCFKGKIRNGGFTISSIDGGKPPLGTVHV